MKQIIISVLCFLSLAVNGQQVLKIKSASVPTYSKTQVDQFINSAATANIIGVASPSTNPGTPSTNVAYNVSDAGTYTYFLDSTGNPITVSSEDGFVIIRYSTATTNWTKVKALIPLTNYVAKSNLSYSEATGKNLFDLNNVIEGEYIIGSNGNVGTGAGWATTPYIPVKPSTYYTWSNVVFANPTGSNKNAIFYDEDSVKIGTTVVNTYNSGLPRTALSPSNAAYVRFTVRNPDDLSTGTSPFYLEQFEEGATATSYAAYENSVRQIIGKNIQASTLTTGNSVPDPSTSSSAIPLSYFNLNAVRNIDITYTVGKNKLNPATVVNDSLIASNGTKAYISGWQMITIPVTAGQAVTFSGINITPNGYWRFAGNADTALSHDIYTGGATATLTAPAGATKFSIDLKRPVDNTSAYASTGQIELNSVATDYEAYIQKVDAIAGIKVNAAVSITDVSGLPSFTEGYGKALSANLAGTSLIWKTLPNQSLNTTDAVQFGSVKARSFNLDGLEITTTDTAPAGTRSGQMYKYDPGVGYDSYIIRVKK